MIDIAQAMRSRKIFGSAFEGDSWDRWLVFGKVLKGLPLEPWETEIAFRHTGRRRFRPGVGYFEAYCGVGRGSGKSRIALALALYQSLFGNEWRKYLSAGERGKCLILAVNREQAAVSFGYGIGLIHSSPYLEHFIESEAKASISLKNKIDIEVSTTNYRGIRGRTVICAILEELAFWRPDETSANPAQEIVRALRPAMMRVPGSLLLGISSVYAREGLLYEKVKEHYGQEDSDILIWIADSLAMNPTLDRRMIDREIEADPQAARAEWLSEFRTDIASFIGSDLLDAAIVPGRVHDLPIPRGQTAFGFADPSGGRSDSFALAISTIDERGKIVILAIREARPPFDPESVVREFSTLLHSYGIAEVTSDRYAGEWTASAWKKFGITPKSMDLNASDCYLNLLPLLTAGRIELPDSARLKSQFLNLERRVRPGGRDSISHPQGRAFHDDIANAVAGAAVLASRSGATAGQIFGMLAYDYHPDRPDIEDPFGDFEEISRIKYGR